jgi:hypothetical protein
VRAQRFDLLVRGFHRLTKDGPRTTTLNRRVTISAALAAMLGVVLSAPNHPAAEASPNNPLQRVQGRKPKRRQKHHAQLKRRRTQRRRDRDRDNKSWAGKPNFIRGESILLVNPANAKSTPHIECVETQILGKCTALAVFDIAPGRPPRVFATSDTGTQCQIARRYSFGFYNAFFTPPFITASINNSTDLCPTSVTSVLDRTTLAEGQTLSVTIEGHEFKITRNADKTDFKYYTLELAPTL